MIFLAASDRTTQDSCYTVTVEQAAFSRLYGEKTQEYRAEVELARKKKEHEKETKKGTKTSDVSKKEWLNHSNIDGSGA